MSLSPEHKEKMRQGRIAAKAKRAAAPSPKAADDLTRHGIEGITTENFIALIESLTKVLLATRQKTLTSYYLGRCQACPHPHINGICRSHCPCHEALTLLDRLGLRPDMANR